MPKRDNTSIYLKYYHHFNDHLKRWVREHITMSIPRGSTILVPSFEGAESGVIQTLKRDLEDTSNFNIMNIPCESFTYAGSNLILGYDLFEIGYYGIVYHQEKSKIYKVLDVASHLCFEGRYDSLYTAMQLLSTHIKPKESKENLQWYMKCLRALATAMDNMCYVRRQNIISEADPDVLAPLVTWISDVVDTVCDTTNSNSLKDICTKSFVENLIGTEFTLMYTIIKQVPTYFIRHCSVTNILLNKLGLFPDITLSEDEIEEKFKSFKKMMEESKFFTSMEFGSSTNILRQLSTKSVDYLPNEGYITTMEDDTLIDYLTPEKISEIIRSRSAAVISPKNINFSLTPELRTMWQKEFSDKYTMVPVIREPEKTRFLIRYKGKTLVAYSLKGQSTKLYGATSVRNEDRNAPTEWTFVEFSGNPNLSYKATF